MRLLPTSRSGQVRLLALFGVFAVLAYLNRTQCYQILSRVPVLYYYFQYSPREGDVVFQSLPHSELTDVIEGMTHSPYSHCGVVLRNDKNQWVVIEAFSKVHETPLLAWEFRGRGGKFAVFRFDSKYDPVIPEFKKELLNYIGHPYYFAFAPATGGSAYSTDLIWQTFEKASGEKIGKPEKISDLDWKPYKEYIGSEQAGTLAWNRLLITPASLARAPQLKEVYQSNF